jgi:predicted CxxxxCH...CXXCH cytochrome family protein
MPRISLKDALRALALTLLLGSACDSRAPIGPTRSPGGEPLPGDPPVATGACYSCHGAPPQTGAHLAHALPVDVDGLVYGDLRILEDVATGGVRYAFGCGHCHPLDPAAHEADLGNDGLPDVVLTPPAQPVAGDAIKRRNAPQAAWDPATGTCSGVYCHSSGLAAPDAPLDYRTTPAWTAAPGTLGCDGCHGNPPRYRSAGSASAAPNSHLQLAGDGWEWGHYAGLPGAWHPAGSKHGGGLGWAGESAAAPITCQTCHFATVDPGNVKAGGFYYLDTQGSYAIDGPEADPARKESLDWQSSQCATCHDGVRAHVGAGKVLPLRHVNGRADVVFDPRPTLPSYYPGTGLPRLAPAAPIAPYYVWPFNVRVDAAALPPGVEVREASDGTSVLAVSLEHASYDPATRTCSNVGCHLERQAYADAGSVKPLRWGDAYEFYWACNYCHPRF